MIFFLYGKDSFRSYQKLKEIQIKFQKTYPETLNFYHLNEESDLLEIKSLLGLSPLFQNKKLIIFKNAFLKKADDQKKLIDLLEAKKIDKSKDAFIVFWERDDVDKRTSLFKYLSKVAQIQKFSELNKLHRKNWAKKIITDKFPDLNLTDSLINYLVSDLGSDLWRIYHELYKISCFASSVKRKLSKQDIDDLVVFPVETDIFKTIDALASKNKKQALKSLSFHFKNLEPELKLLAMFEYQFRSLLKVRSLIDERKSYAIIQKESRLHPFAFRKMFSLAKNFSIEELKKIYDRLFELDLGFKTGKIKDKKIALEMFVVELCQNT